ncbi:MAG: prolipoprotein diacylglyceryl transferase [Thermoleophilia bacterium]|nr:prolipoprotein diacylglyceryl transferase [Thermoleophilia bacterium]
MLPELFSVGPFTLHSFGAMMAISLVVPWWFLREDLRDRGYDPESAFWLMLGAGVGGVAGAKIWYVLDNPGEPLLSGSGLTWYGGLIGGVSGVILAALYLRLPLGEIANAAAAPLAIGYGIGRIGCQLAGDGDYGSPTSLPWGMSYPDGTVPTDQVVHPTPLYEIAAMVVLFWLLWRLRGRVTAPWALFGVYCVLAGLERFLIEFIRRNSEVAAGLTAAQLVSVGLVALGAALFFLARPAAPARR